MINIKKLRKVLERTIEWEERVSVNDKYVEKKVAKDRITIKRKKKMILVKNSNGDIKTKRINYLKLK